MQNVVFIICNIQVKMHSQKSYAKLKKESKCNSKPVKTWGRKKKQAKQDVSHLC